MSLELKNTKPGLGKDRLNFPNLCRWLEWKWLNRCFVCHSCVDWTGSATQVIDVDFTYRFQNKLGSNLKVDLYLFFTTYCVTTLVLTKLQASYYDYLKLWLNGVYIMVIWLQIVLALASITKNKSPCKYNQNKNKDKTKQNKKIKNFSFLLWKVS